jgi:hypothetical protein
MFQLRHRAMSEKPDSDSRYLSGGEFGGATEAAKGSRGSDPRLLGLTMGWLLDRTFGGRPRASRIVQALGLDQLHNTIAQQDRQLNRHRSPAAAKQLDSGKTWLG